MELFLVTVGPYMEIFINFRLHIVKWVHIYQSFFIDSFFYKK